MKTQAERYHWLNTLVGVLDAAFYLSDEEQYLVTDIFNRVLISLNIPERPSNDELPAPVALELKSGFYSAQLAGPRASGRERPVRAVNEKDMVVSVDSWAQAFMDMILVSYPHLDPVERMVTVKSFTVMLVALGLPNRSAAFYPDMVIRAYLESPDALRR